MTVDSSEYAVQPGALIVVTGASSYIGTHIIDILLELGYKVRGTVRAPKPWLNNYFNGKYGPGRFETVIVERMELDGAFDHCFDGAAGVVHVAADLSFGIDPDVIVPITLNGSMNALRAAQSVTSIKRFVLTSSSSATVTPRPNEKYVIDEDSWNDDAVTKAWDGDSHREYGEQAWYVYAAAKTVSEQRAWTWVREQQPGFEFSSIVTTFNVGEILIPETRGSVSMGGLRSLLGGDASILSRVLPQWFVDVKDTARLHVAALLDPAIQQRRLFAYARPYSTTLVLQVFRKLRPENKLIPNPIPDEGTDISQVPPSAEAERLIKRFFGKQHWTDIEASLEAGIKDLA